MASFGELGRDTTDFIVEAHTGGWSPCHSVHRDAEGRRVIYLRDRQLGPKETEAVLEQLTRHNLARHDPQYATRTANVGDIWCLTEAGQAVARHVAEK